jgi:arsenate reductase
MEPKLTVLFICTHNSGRSQIAEAFVRVLTRGAVEVTSAGLEPAPGVNPLVIAAMAEEGIDLAAAGTRSAFDLFRQGRLFDVVITVCDASNDKRCPVYPGVTHRLHWPFADPAAASGTPEERLDQVRAIRDQIRERIAHSEIFRPFIG